MAGDYRERVKAITVTVLAAMLAVGSCWADQQADLIARLRANPTEDFSECFNNSLWISLADADAMVYFQDHKDSLTMGKHNQGLDVGEAHAFKHHLIGNHAAGYANEFSTAIDALTAKE
jgi:hypothetical protein